MYHRGLPIGDIKGVKSFIRKLIFPKPLPETAPVRALISRFFLPGFPFCPFWQGDFLFLLSSRNKIEAALEVGFATGSTACYLLAGTEGRGGVTSIDYRQSEDYDDLGCRMVQESAWAASHEFVEGNSNTVLPEMYRKHRQFDIVFLDGWKTFDHLAVDLYYCNRMLTVGGFLIFDDTRMPAVRKIISLLVTHYQYQEVDYSLYNENIRTKLWFIGSTRSLIRPYRAFQKTQHDIDLPITKRWNYWHRF